MEKLTFLAEEIFSDIPGDPDNVIMTIPPEISASQGWKEGDIITVTVDDGKLILSKQNA